jgi:hypothetical protein
LSEIENSCCNPSLSVGKSVPFADWTASSRARERTVAISPSDPSAVCTIEMPSFALRLAC